MVAGALLLLLPAMSACGRAKWVSSADASRAERGAAALQKTYYNGNGMWAGASYWQRAQVLSSVLDECQATGSGQWLGVIHAVYKANEQNPPLVITSPPTWMTSPGGPWTGSGPGS